MNLKFETIVKIFRKIMQLNVVIIFKSTNEYNRKIISKSGRKMDLYPALCTHFMKVSWTAFLLWMAPLPLPCRVNEPQGYNEEIRLFL